MAGKKSMQLTKDFVSDFYRSGKWIIEIITSDGAYEFWLSYENYGVKDFCFGCSMNEISPDEFLGMVEKNLYRWKVNFCYGHADEEFTI